MITVGDIVIYDGEFVTIEADYLHSTGFLRYLGMNQEGKKVFIYDNKEVDNLEVVDKEKYPELYI